MEAATGYNHGFWGLVSRGATFRSTGRRRTKPGRELIAAHRVELMHSEDLANAHLSSWRAGEANALTAALDDALGKWRSLSCTDRLVFEWPAPVGCIERACPYSSDGGRI